MRIPEIREELEQLSVELQCPRLAELAKELKRRPAVKRAKVHSRPVTDEIRKQVLSTFKQFPHLSWGEIGRMYQIDGGRVSEIVRGKRT